MQIKNQNHSNKLQINRIWRMTLQAKSKIDKLPVLLSPKSENLIHICLAFPQR